MSATARTVGIHQLEEIRGAEMEACERCRTGCGSTAITVPNVIIRPSSTSPPSHNLARSMRPSKRNRYHVQSMRNTPDGGRIPQPGTLVASASGRFERVLALDPVDLLSADGQRFSTVHRRNGSAGRCQGGRWACRRAALAGARRSRRAASVSRAGSSGCRWKSADCNRCRSSADRNCYLPACFRTSASEIRCRSAASLATEPDV